MDIQKFKQIINYNPKRGLIKESKEDTNGWLCIGEIPDYFPWGVKQNKTYIMVDPQERKNFEATLQQQIRVSGIIAKLK